MSDLRTRIAAVIRREVPCHPPAADRIADAVICELDMVQENEMVKDGPLMSDGFQKMKLRHRYVTEWETE